MLNWIGAHRRLLRALLLVDLIVVAALGLMLLQLRPQTSRFRAIGTVTETGEQEASSGEDTHTDHENGAFIGKKAPDFTLPALDGGSVTLSELRGKPVVINLWASWCQPCRTEIPELLRAYSAHKEEGLIVLGVNVASQDTVVDVREFVETFNITFPVLLDENDVVTTAYHMRGIPVSIFVDRDDSVRRIQIGVMRGEQVDAFVSEIMSL
jgi:peroxiredoxin